MKEQQHTAASLKRSVLSTINPPVFLISAALIIVFSLYGGIWSTQAAANFTNVQSWLVTNMGWFYMGVMAFVFTFVVYLVFSPYAHIKLGPDDSKPDYSYMSWIAMLFSAGMGIGLMFFSVAEPLTHFVAPPRG